LIVLFGTGHDQGRKKLTIRQAERQDLDQIVEVHMSSFPGFFLTFLGLRFLRILYQEIQSHPRGILHVAIIDSRVVGFVAGVTEQSGFYRSLMLRRKWDFAFASAKAVLRKPNIVPRLFRALRKPNASKVSIPACLMSIAVDPNSASVGVGTALIQSFSNEMRCRSISSFCLTTDRDGNDNVNRFYRSRDFKLTQTFCTSEGRWMNEYVREIK
jgi:ribosomal protein S18 acetylase RimI-like enzyme